MATHVKVLGWIYLVLGFLGSLLGVLVFAILSFFGIDLTVSNMPHFPFGFFLRTSDLGILIGGLILALSVPAMIAGYGLLQYKRWARILAIILSILNLFHIPLGTAIGAYGLWILLSSEGERHYRQQAVSNQ